ncbi:hypothetical protein BJ508DRAFT_111431 [Ascobolus immersus RN42]|uniref:Fungal N-terminal domain-containing protein n=1 Tax=Ascobolus immersus RN42 TaxID=1160509 RepID=A0A3N4I823_ASCIM|nr:hypothetical protein BJ508DRAFT_111431 [Ascobolus immersus RN42]
MASTLFAVLPSTIAAGMQLFQLVEDMRTGPFDIRDIKKEISELCPILQQLYSRRTDHSVLESSRARRLREENERNLGAVLESCGLILRDALQLLGKYDTHGRAGLIQGMSRFSWVVDGQKKAGKLMKRLEANKLTLSIAVGLLAQTTIEKTGETVNCIYDDQQFLITQIRDLIGKLEKDDISSVLAESPSEHSFLLRRYLESASTYAESTIPDTTSHRDEEDGYAEVKTPNNSSEMRYDISSERSEVLEEAVPDCGNTRISTYLQTMAAMREELLIDSVTPEYQNILEEVVKPAATLITTTFTPIDPSSSASGSGNLHQNEEQTQLSDSWEDTLSTTAVAGDSDHSEPSEDGSMDDNLDSADDSDMPPFESAVYLFLSPNDEDRLFGRQHDTV